jgi:photosystem II stability/assembly factor-like uncharacterized protein
MSIQVFAATANGLVYLRREEGEWSQSGGAKTGQEFTCIAGLEENLLAGKPDGLFRSDDYGQTWWPANEGLTVRHVRWLAYHPEDPDLTFAGTEPAAVFISEDGGRSWQECPEVARLRDTYDWYLPYSPKAGAIRGFAFRGTRGYAAVEQGGLLRSDDRGQTWRLVEGTTGDPRADLPEDHVHPDVHSVVIHADSPDHVFAPTAGGLYETIDGGEHWTRHHDQYSRAVWVAPDRAGHLVLGPAEGVDSNGRIVETITGGETWEVIMGGLEGPWPEHMVDRFAQAGDDLLAVISDGRLLAASLSAVDWEWHEVLPAVQDVRAAVALEQK